MYGALVKSPQKHSVWPITYDSFFSLIYPCATFSSAIPYSLASRSFLGLGKLRIGFPAALDLKEKGEKKKKTYFSFSGGHCPVGTTISSLTLFYANVFPVFCPSEVPAFQPKVYLPGSSHLSPAGFLSLSLPNFSRFHSLNVSRIECCSGTFIDIFLGSTTILKNMVGLPLIFIARNVS